MVLVSLKYAASVNVFRICRYALEINKYLFMDSTKISSFVFQTRKINIESNLLTVELYT